MAFESPIATVDIVLLTLAEGRLQVALYPRAAPPHAGVPALPGGYVHVDEDADVTATAHRVLRQKTALDGLYMEQLATFSGPSRDPRGWSLSVAHVALLPADRLLSGSDDLRLTQVDPLPPGLPFDHADILAAALERVRRKSVYSTLPSWLLGAEFTIAELHEVYRLVLGLERLDMAGFRKKILDLGVIEPVAGRQRTGTHRPAQLYRRRSPGIALFDRTI